MRLYLSANQYGWRIFVLCRVSNLLVVYGGRNINNEFFFVKIGKFHCPRFKIKLAVHNIVSRKNIKRKCSGIIEILTQTMRKENIVYMCLTQKIAT